ncbi:hypothetical protein OCS_02144 [Ophiocordyceps sinensis CO18]|uniref:Myb-like domain-containing protein n=1 Tax=Ophiocordyceps sinensis (strain Co18 / CGMCC 3.14243) TaxID=911162 RepID=T5AK19_OPHSC|nr:hypothetical protein OCS_02144 [Ophiocordyceps sinensis CO18]
MAMSSKNWNDRADKDLFFTILSVKNIGVISGSEWATIGNHMRTLGYGFTNEGCRQHFQGLRRAQNKADANEVAAENAKLTDPTLNPITRRPGPGRGRPRKSQQDMPEQPSQATGAFPGHGHGPGPGPGQVPGAASRSFPGAVTGHFFGAASGQAPGAVPLAPPGQMQQGQEPVTPQQPREIIDTPSAQPVPVSSTQGGEIEEADVDADGAESAGPLKLEEQAQDDMDEHPAKRQRLETQRPDARAEALYESAQDAAEHDRALDAEAEAEHDRALDAEAEAEHDRALDAQAEHELAMDLQNEAAAERALDDEAMLALAAHNGSSAADDYESEFDNYEGT